MRSGKSDGGRGNKERGRRKERGREGRVVNRDFDFGRGERGRRKGGGGVTHNGGGIKNSSSSLYTQHGL